MAADPSSSLVAAGAVPGVDDSRSLTGRTCREALAEAHLALAQVSLSANRFWIKSAAKQHQASLADALSLCPRP